MSTVVERVFLFVCGEITYVVCHNPVPWRPYWTRRGCVVVEAIAQIVKAASHGGELLGCLFRLDLMQSLSYYELTVLEKRLHGCCVYTRDTNATTCFVQLILSTVARTQSKTLWPVLQ